MTTLPILYSFRRCPYAMRARIGILDAGIKVELREIVLRNKPAHMLEISPKGTVPVLLLPNGTVIDESLDIMLWALNQNDPNALLSGDLNAMLKLIQQTNGSKDSHFKFHLDRYKYSTRYEDKDAIALGLESRTTALEFIQQLEDRLSNTKFLMGNAQTLADMSIAPFIRQFANTNRQWWDEQPYPKVQNWLNNFIDSTTFKTIFSKYIVWLHGDDPVYFGDK
ncbi:MAG: glutathione S-transferase [Rhizobiales bacterium]|nr:glutathione S-transferase [Hyphomicrobiales bacterium]